ncbi:MAG: hypothetical protein KUL83_09110 [Lentimicrobium sp.]|jgi:hypothetical protein|nr:hypothetical protein [Lentimicrobium sp.]MDD2528934.1 hypothetical protein [Lentimicrobiaceae bacterium]MDD4598834.1 hypothetical protein [Lentimicrobiaceae bacterium]MDY0026427.1 hypothetical protein [Lentimicrobium sp.]
MSDETGLNRGSLYTGKRPPSLTLLCIMSFIGSGASLLSSVVVALAYNMLPAIAEQSPLPQAKEMIEFVLLGGRIFFVWMSIWYALSLIGVYFMWKLRKKGFHFYTISQLLMLITPLFLFPNYQLPISNLLLTGSFILAYRLNMRFMR